MFVNRFMVASAAPDVYNSPNLGKGIRMVSEGDFIAVFNSIHRVMKAEQYLKEQRLPILLIPAPRSVSSDCGLAIRYAEGDRRAVEEALAATGLVPEMVYRKRGGDYVVCRLPGNGE